MAIIIRGKSKCRICDEIIHKHDEVVSFSVFITNELDDLYFFNDAAFHHSCFYGHELAQEAFSRWQEMTEKLGIDNRFCIVCGKEILDPDSYLALPHFADDADSPLYEFNYLQFHTYHLSEWGRVTRLVELLQKLPQAGDWSSRTINRIISVIREYADRDN